MIGEKAKPERARFDIWKLGVLALFSYYAVRTALSFDVSNPTSVDISLFASFLYGVDLVIHEIGHMVFCGYGTFVVYAGGTLLELIVPLSFILYFIYTWRFFSASLVTFWLGESIIFISFYMATAINMEGEYFAPGAGISSKADNPGLVTDWNYIFSHLGVLQHSMLIAQITYYLGFAVIIVAIIAGIISSREDEEEF